MRLPEAEAKVLLREAGAPVPDGVVVANTEQVAGAVDQVGLPVMVKANSAAGRRFKAGLVSPAASITEAEELTRSFLGRRHEGDVVGSVLVEARAELAEELYLAIAIDDSAGTAVLRMAAGGGTEIEQAVAETASDLHSLAIDPMTGLRPFMAMPLLRGLGLSGPVLPRLADTVAACWRAFWANDATLLEVNPVGVDGASQVVIVDAKLTVDDNALFRHPDWGESGETTRNLADGMGVRYTDLGGDIAILSGGAGMTMAIADAIIHFGGSPANFLDTMGGADADGAYALAAVALERVASDPEIRALLVNLSLVASPMAPFVEGFERAFRERPPSVPVIGSVRGTGAATLSMPLEEATERIRALGVEIVGTIEEAVRASVETAAGAGRR